MNTAERNAVTVLLVDDHPLIRKGLRSLLENEASLMVVGEADDGEQAISLVNTLSPDVVVMDISMPNMNGIDATRHITSMNSSSKVIALSIHSEKRFIDNMLAAGAVGYVLKDSAPEELVRAIFTVMRGEAFLSAPVLGAMVAGFSKSVDKPVVATVESEGAESVLLQTKLHRPEPPKELVPREKLLKRLEDGRARPLHLVSAPAGYGKSVLVSSWLDHCNWPGAWLSLDTDESDLRQFLSYFVAAISGLFPEACVESQGLCNVPELPPVNTIATTLANEIDIIEQPFILVLDDYHRIHRLSVVNNLLTQLLRRPPIPLHLVIITRRDPPLHLMSLRTKEQVTEIRVGEMRLNAMETRSLFEKSTGLLASDDTIESLDREMEGWIVGLRLVSMAARQTEDPETFIKGLHGGIHLAQEYLLHEVLQQQSPVLRDWLLKSAILERFCGSLCEAVCVEQGVDEALSLTNGRFIKDVCESNMFIIPLDTQGLWFRYHHLLQELLSNELLRKFTASEVAALHKRASIWFEGQHLIDEAIDHAMKTGEAEMAASIIERHCYREFEYDRWHVVEQWFSQLEPEIIRQRPVLLLALGWVKSFRQQIDQIPSIIEHIELLLHGKADKVEWLAELAFFRGYLLFWEADLKGCQHQFEIAQSGISRDKRLLLAEVGLHSNIARYMDGQGDESVLAALEVEIQDGIVFGNRHVARMIAAKAFIRILAADFPALEQEASRMRALPDATRTALTNAWGYYFSASADLHLGRFENASKNFHAATKDIYAVDLRAAIDILAGLALTQQLQHQSEEARLTLARLKQLADYSKVNANVIVANSCEARLALLQGDPARAIQLEQYLSEAPGPFDLFIWLEVPAITRVRVLIAVGSEESLKKAQLLIEEVQHVCDSCRLSIQSMELSLLNSLVLYKQGSSERALKALKAVIDLAQPVLCMRPFIELGQPMTELIETLVVQQGETDYLRHVLDEIRRAGVESLEDTAPRSKLISSNNISNFEPLTNRELDILVLLEKRLQNKEMANRLFVSPETVKTHLKHLYQKLGVSNRRDAVTSAAELLAEIRWITPSTVNSDTE